MRYQTSQLDGAPLHFAVAYMLEAEFRPNSIGAQHAYLDDNYIGGFITRLEGGVVMPHDIFAPSRLVSYGAEIAERVLQDRLQSVTRTSGGWYAVAKGRMGGVAYGETTRLAGLRAVLCSVLGETVEIPDWLEFSPT